MCAPEDAARAGFTLVEAAAAIAVIAVVAVAWLAAVGTQLAALTRASEAATATALARDRLSAVRLWLHESRDRLPDSLQSGHFAPPLDAYEWESHVQPAPLDLPLLDVRVTVRWPAGAQTLHTRIRTPDEGSEPAAGARWMRP